MNVREATYREAERRLWGSLGVRPVESRVRLERVECDVRVKLGILLSEAERASIRSPVRFAWGDVDPLDGPEVAGAFATSFHAADLVIVPGGHAPWMDDPVGAASLTAGFLVGAAPTPGIPALEGLLS